MSHALAEPCNLGTEPGNVVPQGTKTREEQPREGDAYCDDSDDLSAHFRRLAPSLPLKVKRFRACKARRSSPLRGGAEQSLFKGRRGRWRPSSRRPPGSSPPPSCRSGGEVRVALQRLTRSGLSG